MVSDSGFQIPQHPLLAQASGLVAPCIDTGAPQATATPKQSEATGRLSPWGVGCQISAAAYGSIPTALLHKAGPALNDVLALAVDPLLALVRSDRSCADELHLIEREGIADLDGIVRGYLRLLCKPGLTLERHQRVALAIGRSFKLLVSIPHEGDRGFRTNVTEDSGAT
jgi:hypothetical protein